MRQLRIKQLLVWPTIEELATGKLRVQRARENWKMTLTRKKNRKKLHTLQEPRRLAGVCSRSRAPQNPPFRDYKHKTPTFSTSPVSSRFLSDQDRITVQRRRSLYTRTRSGSSSGAQQRVHTAGRTRPGPMRPP
ncbi:hypothetical protein HispidOSU_023770 [Sigmodon hispidus]